MTLRKTFNEIHTFRVTNMQSKMSFAKYHPFCSGIILIKVMDNYAYMIIGVKIIQVMCFVLTLIAAWIIPTHSARPIESSNSWLFFHVLLLYCSSLGLLNLRSLISEVRNIWFGINKNRSFESRSYLPNVTAVMLRRLLPNINLIFNRQPMF